MDFRLLVSVSSHILVRSERQRHVHFAMLFRGQKMLCIFFNRYCFVDTKFRQKEANLHQIDMAARMSNRSRLKLWRIFWVDDIV